jgi:hypothetical protein
MLLDQVLPHHAAVLRRVLPSAAETAYAENCARFFPEELGDNNLTFAITVVHNLRFLIEEDLRGEAGFEVRRPRNAFEVGIVGTHSLYVYKASTVPDVRAMRFDDSLTQLEISQGNSDQLAFKFQEDELPAIDVGLARRLVAVHVGNGRDGYQGFFIGAPTAVPVSGYRWLWLEPLDEAATARVAVPLVEKTRQRNPWTSDADIPELRLSLRADADQANSSS